MDWYRAEIRTKVRNLTGQTDTNDLSDADLDKWINEYYQEQMPDEIDLQSLRTFYTFSLTVGTDIYTKDSDILVLRKPVYIDEGQIDLHKDPASFWQKFVQYPPWQASRAYIVGDVVVSTSSNGYLYKCTVAGTSDTSEPTWPTTLNDTVTDNTATWEYYKDDTAEPTDVLDHAGNLYFRPCPNYAYYFKCPATQRPTALSDTNTSIIDNRLGLLISIGTAILILEDNGDYDEAARLVPLYRDQVAKISGREGRNKSASRGIPRF